MTDSLAGDLPALQTSPADQSGTQPFIPAETRALLGPAPITHLEHEEAYERLLSKMAEAVAPTDFVEWTWLKDIVDLEWEAARARRAKTAALALARRKALENIIRADRNPELSEYDLEGADLVKRSADKIYRSMAEDNKDKTFSNTLVRLGLKEEAVSDAAYLVSLDMIERLQLIIDNANIRRNLILREIDRRRDALGRRMREAVASSDEIVDAEFDSVPSPG
jgi:hypothetical protein